MAETEKYGFEMSDDEIVLELSNEDIHVLVENGELAIPLDEDMIIANPSVHLRYTGMESDQ